MAIDWGTTDSHLRVGIEIDPSPGSVGKGTTSVELTIRYYVQAVDYGWADDQTLTLTGEFTGSVNYRMSSDYSETRSNLVATRSKTVSTSYSSSTRISVGARVSGAYNGATPSVSTSYTVAKRPPSAPDKPNTPTMGAISYEAAWVDSTPNDNNGDSVDLIQYQWSESSGFGSSRSDTQTPWAAYRMANLDRATTYYVRVRARNSAGWSDWSSARSFKTDPTKPDKQNSSLNVSSITPTSARASWGTPNNGGSSITGFDVQRATNSGFSSGVVTRSTSDSPYDWTGLTPGQDYWVRSRAKNGVGAADWSPGQKFTTLSGAKVYNGSSWVDIPAKVYNGSSWVTVVVQKRNSAWES